VRALGHHADVATEPAESLSSLEAALAEGETGERWEAVGRARYFAADYRGAIDAHERAFAAYRDEADLLGAGRAARAVSWLYGNLHGDWVVGHAWLARGARVLAEAGEDSREHGWIEVMAAFDEPPGEARERRLRLALELARRFGDHDLEVMAVGRLGHTYVLVGRVEEGMLMLDEALAAVCAGEVHDLAVSESCFCGMFQACERAQDVPRVEQWMRTADDVARRRNLVQIGAFCRAHYASVLTAAGRWEEAEDELDQAARLFERSYAANRAGVLVRLADLRVRQGRLEEAAVLLDGLDQHREATRTVAAIHLARGEAALALEAVHRGLAEPTVHAPVAASLLTLAVDAHLARGDVAEAEATARRLEELAARHGGHYVRAVAALAAGRVCLASGSGDARACLREALAAFSLAQMPVELARVRLELARAVAEEQPEVAVAEARSALEAFELRRAARDADAAASLLRSLGAAGRHAPRLGAQLTSREHEVLELLGHGLSNREIAERLFITRKTAEHHVGRVLAKLGVRSRAEAAAYAARTAAERSGSG
jgi:DNA-binding CsgD family transcriptional regulator